VIVAFDLDGTAFAYPELFSEMMRGLQKADHLVGFLTARPAWSQHQDLVWLRQNEFPEPDFFFSRLAEEETMPAIEWKKRIMETRQIDYLFDDFSTRTIRLVTLKRPVR